MTKVSNSRGRKRNAIRRIDEAMSEYQNVEKPFLDQLAALGWTVIDQGPAIPSDPTQSLRSNFREVTLKEEFVSSVCRVNLTKQDEQWLTEEQLEKLHEEIIGQSGSSLREINEKVQALLYRTQVDKNESTGEEDPNVQLIDFKNPENNSFHAINQFRIDTPGGVKDFIIPDIVLFVNGLPVVVVECKDLNSFEVNPMAEAFKQLMRYSEQREATAKAGLKEGEPRLFHANQFVVRTDGDHCQFGTVTSTSEEFFYPWRSVFPEQYQQYDPPLGKERQQELLIQGMLPKATILDIMRSFTVFMDVGTARAKIVCRYQQYRAALKIVDRLRTKETGDDRSGVIWHTQGSGKSLTMVFLIRKMRRCEDLKMYKICLVTDRSKLEEQLSKTAILTGETVTEISSRDEVHEKLSTDSSNLNMVMVHKFFEANRRGPKYLESALEIPKFENFGVVNESEKVLLMIDEGHRTQSSDLSDNLFEAFPNATRLAFTGTPLIRVLDDKLKQHKSEERFGDYIDTYKLQDSVKDGATIQILYEGKTADGKIEGKAEFDAKVDELAQTHIQSQLRKSQNREIIRKEAKEKGILFDDLFKKRTDEEIRNLKKKWGTTGDLLEADDRIEQIANDLVNHYVANILPNGFKAQVVCSSKMACIKYKKYIDKAIANRLANEVAKPEPPTSYVKEAAAPMVTNSVEETGVSIAAESGIVGSEHDTVESPYRNQELINRISLLQSAVVISSDGTNEAAVLVEARKHSRTVNAVESFKSKFDFGNPERKENAGLAFLIVCDMLLTGFDAPIEQVMYIDKKVKSHNLLQTIARVNRVATGKDRGYIVDYIGLSNHLKEALSIYAGEDEADPDVSLQSIDEEIPRLESRYNRLIQLFQNAGVKKIEDFVQQNISDSKDEFQVLESAIAKMEDIRQRANFEVYLKTFYQSMDIILPKPAAHKYKIPARRFGYLLIKVRDRYKDDSLSITNIGGKIQALIDQHLVSLGVDSKIPPVELLSEKFITELDKNGTSQGKASEMEHSIRKHCRVKFDEDPAFYRNLSEKLEELLKQHQENWDELCEDLLDLRAEAAEGRIKTARNVDPKAGPFYALIVQAAFGSDTVPSEYAAQVSSLANLVVKQLQGTIHKANFWRPNNPDVETLQGELSDLFLLAGIDEIEDHSNKIINDITQLAKVRHEDLTSE